MATDARDSAASFGRTPDYRTANEAIDSVMANAAFGQRRDTLKRQYKRSERQMDFAGKEAKAAAERAAKVGLGVQQTGKGVQAQQAQYESYGKELQQRVRDFNQYTKQHSTVVVDPKTGKKQTVVNLTGAALKKWQDQQRQLQTEQARYKAEGKGLKQSAARYNASLAQSQALQRRAEKRNARYQRLYKSYVASYQRYKRFANYVPYRPA